MSSLELRTDPLSGAKTIIASDRASRPGGGFEVVAPPPIVPEQDPFLEGHEDQTPPEVFALRPTDTDPDTRGWRVRVVPNLYPALSQNISLSANASPLNQTEDSTSLSFSYADDVNSSRRGIQPSSEDLFLARPAEGAHEVIINAPEAVSSLAELSLQQLELAMTVWQQRMRTHEKAQSIHMSINEGVEGGASLPHTHGQLYAFDFVPAVVARERERFSAYAAQTMGGNLLSDVLQEEVRRADRIVSINDEAVLLTPFASRAPYQLMIVPRKSSARYENESFTAADLLYEGIHRLKHCLGASPSMNIWVRTSPLGAEHFCWRIDIFPRLSTLAALELGTGINLCVMPPEVAAKHLRAVETKLILDEM